MTAPVEGYGPLPEHALVHPDSPAGRALADAGAGLNARSVSDGPLTERARKYGLRGTAGGKHTSMLIVADFLQSHPRRGFTSKELATATGLTTNGVQKVLRRFSDERDDVTRSAKGGSYGEHIYTYTPGGPGRLARKGADSPAVTAKPEQHSWDRFMVGEPPQMMEVVGYAGDRLVIRNARGECMLASEIPS